MAHLVGSDTNCSCQIGLDLHFFSLLESDCHCIVGPVLWRMVVLEGTSEVPVEIEHENIDYLDCRDVCNIMQCDMIILCR